MSQTNIQTENKMGVMPVGKLLLNMSLPVMLSMLAQALYNVVDSLYVARVSENALAAVSLAFPVQNLMIAIAVGTGVGVSALLSRSLGERNFAEVNSAANNGVFLAIMSSIVFMVLGTFFSRTFFTMQTDIAEIVEGGVDYLSIVTIGSLALFVQILMERLLQATGRSMYSMVSQIAGALTNIVLDPVFIFGWAGMPRMGVAGAALATVIGQAVGALLGIYFNLRHNPDIRLSLKRFKPNPATIRRIYSVGLPSMVMQSISSVMMFGMNRILLAFSSTAATVFGVYYKLQSFVFMPVFGLNNGMVPIIAYSQGARHKDRMIRTIKLSVLFAMVIMLLGILVCQLFPETLMRMFDASEDMMAIGVRALRVISLHFIFAGYCIVVGSVFQALGNGVLSLINSIMRQLVVLLPVAYVLSIVGGLDAVWWAFPIAEIASAILSTIFLRRVYIKEIKPL